MRTDKGLVKKVMHVSELYEVCGDVIILHKLSTNTLNNMQDTQIYVYYIYNIVRACYSPLTRCKQGSYWKCCIKCHT
jgi:hypothetical protein